MIDNNAPKKSFTAQNKYCFSIVSLRNSTSNLTANATFIANESTNFNA